MLESKMRTHREQVSKQSSPMVSASVPLSSFHDGLQAIKQVALITAIENKLGQGIGEDLQETGTES